MGLEVARAYSLDVLEGFARRAFLHGDVDLFTGVALASPSDQARREEREQATHKHVPRSRNACLVAKTCLEVSGNTTARTRQRFLRSRSGPGLAGVLQQLAVWKSVLVYIL